MFFLLQVLSFQIKDLEIRKFMDKYLLCVFSHNKFLICSEMATWRDSGSQTGSELHRLMGSYVILIQWAVS